MVVVLPTEKSQKTILFANSVRFVKAAAASLRNIGIFSKHETHLWGRCVLCLVPKEETAIATGNYTNWSSKRSYNCSTDGPWPALPSLARLPRAGRGMRGTTRRSLEGQGERKPGRPPCRAYGGGQGRPPLPKTDYVSGDRTATDTAEKDSASLLSEALCRFAVPALER